VHVEYVSDRCIFDRFHSIVAASVNVHVDKIKHNDFILYTASYGHQFICDDVIYVMCVAC
jgi:hypothetical protein